MQKPIGNPRSMNGKSPVAINDYPLKENLKAQVYRL